MADDAIKAIRALFVSTLALYLLWCINWPSVLQLLDRYEHGKHLEAWLLLRELSGIPEVGLIVDEACLAVQQPCELTISDYVPTEPEFGPRGRDFAPTARPLSVPLYWPRDVDVSVTLRAESRRVVGGVAMIAEADASVLPLEEYRVVFTSSRAFVVHVEDEAFWKDARRTISYTEFAGSRRSRPRYWNDTRRRLAGHGFDGEADALDRRGGPALARLRAESDPNGRTVRVFGVSFTLGSFVGWFGLLVTAVAFGGIGPLVTLGRAATPIGGPWIMTLPRGPGTAGFVLECAILLASGVWAAFPLLIVSLQLPANSRLDGGVDWFSAISAVGLVLSSAVFVLIALELRRNRTSAPE